MAATSWAVMSPWVSSREQPLMMARMALPFCRLVGRQQPARSACYNSMLELTLDCDASPGVKRAGPVDLFRVPCKSSVEFMKSCILAVLGCALWAASVAGRDIYVSNVSGDDRSTGDQTDNVLQFRGPVRTIAKALRLAQPGDRIVLEASEEPYR